MARKISMAALFLVLVANLLQSGYGTTYTVGDTVGWGIPTTNNDDFYDDWSDNKDFVVGDVLVFNFTTSTHNVVEVTEADYDACSTANAISIVSNGPASIALNRTGDHYFICGIPGHCSAGQKLNVEVRMGTGAPVAPTPRTPTPTPTPTPSTNSMTYTVGDSTGWAIPPANNDDFYDDWNDNKDFFVGDVLVFNFTTGQHDVAEVTEAAYDSCNTANPISTVSNGPARITLNRTGDHYFICGIPGHCSAGQKLNVEVRMGTGSPVAPTPRTPTPTPTPSTNSMTYTVGDSTGWGIPPTNNDDFYDDWNDNKDFFVGDVLVFNFTTSTHNVVEVTEAGYDGCSTANAISTVNNGPARITLNRTGDHYFICGIPGHCSAGQKLNVEVRTGSRTTPVPTPRPTPTTPGTPRPSPTPSTNVRTYTVGDTTGWTIPPTNNDDFYDDWNDNKDFVVGDVLVFNFTTGQHDVAEVTEAAYDSCNTANPISTVTNGPARITLNRTGEHYFICTVPGHCSAGQKLNVEVRIGNRTTIAPTPRPSPTMPGAPSPTPTTTPGAAPSPTTTGAASPTTPVTPGGTVPGTPSANAPGTSIPPAASSASSYVATSSLVFIMYIALALLC